MGCACNSTKAVLGTESSITAQQIMENSTYRDVMADKKIISKDDFKKGDYLSLFRYVWCIDKNAFMNEYAKLGIEIQEEELPVLAELAINGGDLAGNITDNAGNPIKFSIMDTFYKIRLSKEKIAKSSCTIQFI